MIYVALYLALGVLMYPLLKYLATLNDQHYEWTVGDRIYCILCGACLPLGLVTLSFLVYLILTNEIDWDAPAKW